jgi:hypothetical protein
MGGDIISVAVPANTEELDVTTTVRVVTPSTAGQFIAVTVTRVASQPDDSYSQYVRLVGVLHEYY